MNGVCTDVYSSMKTHSVLDECYVMKKYSQLGVVPTHYWTHGAALKRHSVLDDDVMHYFLYDVCLRTRLTLVFVPTTVSLHLVCPMMRRLSEHLLYLWICTA